MAELERIKTGGNYDKNMEDMLDHVENSNINAVKQMFESGFDVHRPVLSDAIRTSGSYGGDYPPNLSLLYADRRFMLDDVGWIAYIIDTTLSRIPVDMTKTLLLPMLSLFIEHGAPVSYQNPKTGNTPLHTALMYDNSWDTLEFLLVHGANIDAVNDMGMTPQQFAADFGLQRSVALLQQDKWKSARAFARGRYTVYRAAAMSRHQRPNNLNGGLLNMDTEYSELTGKQKETKTETDNE